MPNISVLIPTRERFEYAKKAIDSLRSKAYDALNIEYLLKIDQDDDDSLLSLIELPDDCRWVINERRRGYLDMHLYVNELCEIAKGKLLLLWNDDVFVETENWDKIMLDTLGDDEVSVLQIKTGTQFPCITRKLYDILGHFAQHCANDSYIEFVVKGLGIMKHTDVEVEHLHGKLNDKLWKERQSITKEQHAHFWSQEMQDLIRIDKMKIIKYMTRG